MSGRIRFLTDARGSPDGLGRVVLSFEEGDVAQVPEDCPEHLARAFTREGQPTRRAEWVEDDEREMVGAPEEGALAGPSEEKFTPAAWDLAEEHGVTEDDLGEPSGASGDYLKSDVEGALEGAG